MASITTNLDTRKANKKGEFPAKFLICAIGGSTAYIPLNFQLLMSDWRGNGQSRPVAGTHPLAKTMNDRIEMAFIKFREKMIAGEISGEISGRSAIEIKQFLLEKQPVAVKTTHSRLFAVFANEYIIMCRSEKTRETYVYMMKKLIEYGREKITFKDIDYVFLRDFNAWLEKGGIGVNTRSIIFRNIRTVYNRAIDDGYADGSLYPFRKFKIRSEQREKECLTPAQVRALYGRDFGTAALNQARDFFMLSFFLCGINPVDLYSLKKPDKDLKISFIRSKTQHSAGETIRMLLQPEALEIIEKYRSDDETPYLLIFQQKYADYEVFLHFIQKNIREIAALTGFDGLTLYWARYSWATIADGLDIQEKTISKALGHADRSMAGRKYIAYDWAKVDAANRRVIDWVMQAEAEGKKAKGGGGRRC
jgi:integrase